MKLKLALIIFTFLLSNLINCQLKFVEDEDPQRNEFLSHKKIDDILRLFNRIFQKENQMDKDVIDYVMSLERVELIDLAYNLERYHRTVFNQTGLMGGLHDYVFKISDDKIRNYIFKELNEHPEICNKSILQKFVSSSKSQTEEIPEYKRDFILGEGIHDYLQTLDRPKMNSLALALENYHRKLKDEFIFGGLHDYVDSVSDEDIRSYILKEINEHSEINSLKAIKKLLNH